MAARRLLELPIMTRRNLPAVLHLLLALSLAASVTGESRTANRLDKLRSELQPYVRNGGVVVTSGEQVLFDYHGDESFTPASTLKVPTALAALHYLGEDFHFRTELYLSGDHDLTIRGYGDPFLVSEEWAIIARELVDSGQLPAKLRNLCLDASSYGDVEIPGIATSLDPYNARNGALVANFNTVYVAVERGGRVRSAESQTPLTPLARELGRGLAPGKHRINISRRPERPLRYVGEIAREFLAARGVEVTGRVAPCERGPGDRLILTHYNTRPLTEIIAGMMEYSNNFVANQLLLTLGLVEDGEPATLEQGVALLGRFLEEHVGLDRAEFALAEGSGISRGNRFTPLALAEVVRRFEPHRELLSERNGVALKTGTLTGVYALAGYLPSEQPLVFVILLNQPRNHRDQVLAALRQHTASFERMLAPARPADTGP